MLLPKHAQSVGGLLLAQIYAEQVKEKQNKKKLEETKNRIVVGIRQAHTCAYGDTAAQGSQHRFRNVQRANKDDNDVDEEPRRYRRITIEI